MVTPVQHGMSQIVKQTACILTSAAVSIALRTLMPRSMLSSPLKVGFFHGVIIGVPTIYACQHHGGAGKTALVAFWFFAALLAGMSSMRPQPRPSLRSLYSGDKVIDFSNPSFAFSLRAVESQTGTLNFVKMTQNGQERLIPVRVKNNLRSITLCTDILPINIYLSILAQEQDQNSMTIKTFLSYWNAEAEKDFLTIAGSDNPPILSFSPSKARETLQLARQHDSSIRDPLQTISQRLARPSLSARYVPGNLMSDLSNQPLLFPQGWKVSEGDKEELNFIKMTQNGQKRLIHVRYIPQNHGRYSVGPCTDGFPINTYMGILMNEPAFQTSSSAPPLMPIKTFLSYWDDEAEKQFLTTIALPFTSKLPPIFSFSPSRACEALQLAKSYRDDLSICASLLHTPAEIDPAEIDKGRVEKGQSLFTSWIGQGQVDLIKVMIELGGLYIIPYLNEANFQDKRARLFTTAGELAQKATPLTPEELGHVREAKIIIDALEGCFHTLSPKEESVRQAIFARVANDACKDQWNILDHLK